MHTGNPLNAGDPIEQQFLKGVHVLDENLDLIISVLPGDEQAFEHFGAFPDFLFKVLEALGRVLVH